MSIQKLNKNIIWRIFKVIYWSIAYPLCVISVGYCLGSIIYGICGLFTEIESTGMECLAISAGSLFCLLPIILLYFIIRRLIIYIVFDKEVLSDMSDEDYVKVRDATLEGRLVAAGSSEEDELIKEILTNSSGKNIKSYFKIQNGMVYEITKKDLEL